MEKKVTLTRDGYQKLVDELAYLKGTKREEVKESLAKARSFGDLSENSEYDEAKNEQARLEADIARLEEQLKNVVIVETISTDVVSIGTKVKLLDMEFDEETEYRFGNKAAAGDEIEIPVSVTNNPGLTGMTFSLEYDDSVLLIDYCDHGGDRVFRGLSFTEPKTYKNGCNLVWYGAEVKAVKDGEAMIFVVTIADDAPAGTYTFRLSGEKLYDADGNQVAVKYITGTITVTG